MKAWWGAPLAYCFGVAFVLKGLDFATESLRTNHAVDHLDSATFWAFKAENFVSSMLAVPVFAAMLMLLDRLTADGWRRQLQTAAVVAAGAVLAALAMLWPLSDPPWAVRVGASASVQAWFLYCVWCNLLYALIAVLGHARLRASRQADERLAQVRRAGSAVRERLAQARLSAIQARVDPQLLFELLDRVKRHYEQDAARAEALLDELTDFLRAALPRLRRPLSTLEVEFALVRSWGRLVQHAFGVPVHCDGAPPAALEGAPFPAGVLLPLIGTLVGSPPRSSRIELSARGAGERIVVALDCSRAPPGDELAKLRAALGDLYSGRAQLRLNAPTAGTARVEIDIPGGAA